MAIAEPARAAEPGRRGGLFDPRIWLAAGLAYIGSPLSFYIVFRGTNPVNPYPAASDLAIDAALTIALLAIGVAIVLVRERRLRYAEPVCYPAIAFAAVAGVAGLYGLAKHNPLRYIGADAAPII